MSQTRTVTYMVPNGDGTFGLRAESEAIIAPVSVAGTGITINVAGPVGFRVTATGKPGDPRNGVEFTDTAVVTINLGPATLATISFQDLLGPNGFELDIPLVATLRIAAPPKGLSGTGAPAVAADGTSASASMDVVRLNLLDLLGVLDLGVGHFEGAAQRPRRRYPLQPPGEQDRHARPGAGGSGSRVRHQHPQRPGPVQRPVRL